MKHTSLIRNVNRNLSFIAILMLAWQANAVYAEEAPLHTIPKAESPDRYFIGSSASMLANLSTNRSPNYYQLDVGYKLNPKESIIVSASTFRYFAPLGIPFGPSHGAASEDYPGSVKACGIGIGYQRFVTEQVFTSIHAMSLSQSYRDTANNEIQKGSQLLLDAKLGYHMEFFDKKFYLEPTIGVLYWPVNTNVPASFAARDNKWKNYFLFDPSINFGMNF